MILPACLFEFRRSRQLLCAVNIGAMIKIAGVYILQLVPEFVTDLSLYIISDHIFSDQYTTWQQLAVVDPLHGELLIELPLQAE